MSNSQIGKALAAKEKNDPAATSVEDSTVLNIIYMGTACHHCNKDSQCILTALHKVIDTSQQFVHIIDGPGAKPKKKKKNLVDEQKALENPMLGTYDFTCEFDAKENKLKMTKTPHHLGTLQTMVKETIHGKIRGKGYKKVVEEIIQVCDALMKSGKIKFPLIINMYGYSRGGDTTLRAANILQAEYGLKDVRINIFAIDPVPGPWRKQHMKARIIPPIVDEYHSTLMAHELTPGYEPMDASWLIPLDPVKTKIYHKVCFGGHGTAMTVPKNSQIADSAMLLWDNIHRFAARHGTRFKKKYSICHIES